MISRRSSFLLQTAAAVALLKPLRANAQAPTKVRLAGSISDSYASPLYAAGAGFFEKAGLDVDMTIFGNSGQSTQGLIANAFDVGFIDLMNLSIVNGRGVPVAAIAPGGLYSTDVPTSLLVVPKDSPIRKATDLENQAISVPGLGSAPELAVREWLRKSGANAEKIRIIELTQTEMLAGLPRGTVQAAFLAEPFYTQARNDVRVLARVYDAISTSFYISVCVATRDWIGKNAALAHRVAQAIDDTNAWANSHHDESAQILANYAKMDVALIRATNRIRFGTALDPSKMQPIMDAAFRYGKINRQISAAEVIARV